MCLSEVAGQGLYEKYQIRRLKMKRVYKLLFIFQILFWLAVGAAIAEQAPELKFEKFTLDNGMDVILHEDHSIPVVAVNVWYHVGSKNEKRGRTGFAHLFEHMMFQGSEHSPGEYFLPLEKIGGRINGSTSEDRTNYWENLPGNYLELALWMESDRLGFLLPGLTQEKLDNQRDVVKNERRQHLENEPYGKVYDLIPEMMYPGGHPYSWPVIGSMEDLSAASLEDVSEFFKKYYTPSNASLVIAGDFEPEAAKKLVEKYFGTLMPGPPVERMTSWIPELDGVKRVVAEDNVELPRLYYLWHTPALYAPGDAEFDLFANILGSGKTSRLYKALVYEQQIAQDVSVYQDSRELGSTFNVEVTAKAGHSLDEIEQAVEAELQKVLSDGVTADELAQAQISWESAFVRRLQRLGGFGGRADVLNNYNVFLGDPDKLAWDMERYAKVTVEDLQAYVKEYIDLNKRGILHIVPQGKLVAGEGEVDRSSEPSPAAESAFTPPKIQQAKLSNGLEVLLVEDHRLPLVHLGVVVKSGWAADPKERFGTAALTAELLDEGTKSRSALEIAEEAKRLGAHVSTGGFFDGSNINLNVLKKNFDPALKLVADIVLNPTFPDEELERRRRIYLGRIKQESKQPFTVALKSYMRVLYGSDHPYSQPYTGSGTEASIKAISRSDLVSYYKAHYFRNNATIVVAGDITLAEARKKLEKAFKKWKRGDVAGWEVPRPQAPASTKIYLVDKPGAVQSVIAVGNLALSRSDPDHLALKVMNNSFGGQFTSRLNLNLREDKGYTYGVRSFLIDTRGVGPLICGTRVHLKYTKESLAEIDREMRELVGDRPLSDIELADSKNNLIKGFPQRFQTYSGIAGQLSDLVLFDIPLDDWDTYIDRVDGISGTMATKAAKDYVHPGGLVIVIVGDREKIEEGIRELNVGEIEYLDEYN
jgi:zinc protease